MDYREAVDYLMTFADMERGYMPQSSPNPVQSLESVRSLLSRLNNPHRGRSTVHVTGSKGKGSTAAMIASILTQEGLRTSLYSSPHLHSFTERIAIDGDTVSPEEFAAGIDAIRGKVEEERESVHGGVSTFGVITALYFWLTRAQIPGIDWQVVEVGLGGTFDATNIFERSEIAVITPISLEHTAILGPTTVHIARDKAGIIKPGSTCVLAPQKDPAVVEVIRERCGDVGAKLVEVAAEYSIEPREHFSFGQSFRLTGRDGQVRDLRTVMLGRHQLDNAATAVAVADAIRERGSALRESSIVDGLARARIHGRVEVMGQRPLIVADGAHNIESAAALADTLRDYFEWRKCYFVIGANKDKDVRGMGFKLARLAELIVCCGFDNPRAMDPYVMIQEVGFLGPPAVAEPSVAAALDTALSYAGPEDLVCITGSLYVVAEARAHILGESVTSF